MFRAMVLLLLLTGTVFAQTSFTAGPGLAFAVPDNTYTGTLASMGCNTLNVPGTFVGNVDTASVQVRLTHTFVGDLTIKLVNPAGTVATLVSRPGVIETADDGTDTAGFGENSNLLIANPLTYIQTAPSESEQMGKIPSEHATGDTICVFAGSPCSYNPDNGAATSSEDLTTAFDGSPGAGNWQLCLGDSAGADVGTLDGWTLTLTPVAGATADLSITKTNGVTSVAQGGTTTYMIVASNAGPDAATGATVADTFPAGCASVAWTCVGAGGGTCTASGSGNINDTAVNLPSGGSATYSAVCSIGAAATGTLSNTATATAPGTVTDPTPGNNSATDGPDTIVANADLSITKTNGAATVAQGGTTTYTIVASNAGPITATGATVADTFPAGCASVAWTCTGAGGGTCAASGSGNINDATVNLPSGGSVTYSAVCSIGAAATGTLSNTATVTAPGTVTDPTPGNNSATDGPDNILTDVPPVFAYTPPPGPVTLTGGTTVGTTGSASIAVTIGTAGLGSGANATTTTTCTAPGGFTGFTQTVTAVGPAATTTGGPLTGTCTLGAAAVTAAMTCNEVQGSTTVVRTFDLTCPAGTAVPLTSTPISGSTVTMPQQTLGNPATTSVITFQNPGLAAATVTCTAPVATQFTAAPLTINVPASGNGTTTVTFNSAVVGSFTGVLNCTAGAQAFTFNLAGTTGVPATAVPAMGNGMRELMLLAMLAMGLIAVGVYSRRS